MRYKKFESFESGDGIFYHLLRDIRYRINKRQGPNYLITGKNKISFKNERNKDNFFNGLLNLVSSNYIWFDWHRSYSRSVILHEVYHLLCYRWDGDLRHSISVTSDWLLKPYYNRYTEIIGNLIEQDHLNYRVDVLDVTLIFESAESTEDFHEKYINRVG
jgi:hypothetical protein